jgi:hypothetical protein
LSEVAPAKITGRLLWLGPVATRLRLFWRRGLAKIRSLTSFLNRRSYSD